MENKPLIIASHLLTYGADPEAFLVNKRGKVVGSELVVPEEGIQVDNFLNAQGLNYPPFKGFIRDGVQIELNVPPTTCRDYFGQHVAKMFITLDEYLKDKEVRPSFQGVVRMPSRDMKKLSERSRELGCQPSLNKYNPNATVNVTHMTKNLRSAGGHIHMGLPMDSPVREQQLYDRLVVLMDIWVGTTCVMLDRDPLAATRRKLYGRAGEYRVQPHGMEYRTLSNFWLRSYQLTSLVLGLSKLAYSTLHTQLFRDPMHQWNAESELVTQYDLREVERVINENDLDGAKRHWAILKEFIRKYIPARRDIGHYGIDHIPALDAGSVDVFQYFLDKVEEKGLDYWFAEDPVDHWKKLLGARPRHGWEKFLMVMPGGPRDQKLTEETNARLSAAQVQQQNPAGEAHQAPDAANS